MNQCIIINTLKAEMKLYNDKVYTHFEHKMLKDNEYWAYLSVILLDSTFVNSNKVYYSQIFLRRM